MTLTESQTSTQQIVPPNCEQVNGHLVCQNDDGLFDLFTAGEGWWGFNLTKEQAFSATKRIDGSGGVQRLHESIIANLRSLTLGKY